MILFQGIICLPTTIFYNEGGENLTVYILEPSIKRFLKIKADMFYCFENPILIRNVVSNELV